MSCWVVSLQPWSSVAIRVMVYVRESLNGVATVRVGLVAVAELRVAPDPEVLHR